YSAKPPDLRASSTAAQVIALILSVRKIGRRSLATVVRYKLGVSFEMVAMRRSLRKFYRHCRKGRAFPHIRAAEPQKLPKSIARPRLNYHLLLREDGLRLMPSLFVGLGSLLGRSNSSSIKASTYTFAARAYCKRIINGGSFFPRSYAEIL